MVKENQILDLSFDFALPAVDYFELLEEKTRCKHFK
jgi:hypothetical protein